MSIKMIVKITFLLLTFLANPLFGQYSLYSVFFNNSTAGYLVGIDWETDTNLILKTTNGGEGWTIKSSGDPCILFSVYFTDEENGFAVGENILNGGGVIYKTTNAGDDWIVQYTNSSNSLLSVQFPDNNVGYIAGADYFQGNVILKTTDGGISWNSQSSGTNQWLWSIYFVDQNIGYASGSGGTIIKTTNGGEDWETLQSGTSISLNSIWFTSTDIGYVVGENGTLLKTTDSGSSWNNVNTGTNSFLHSIYFNDSQNGYAVGNLGTILKTSDGGSTWSEISGGTLEDLRSVYFTGDSIGYTIGTGETFLKTIDQGISWNTQLIKTILVLSPNGGETWNNTSTHTINWIGHLIENVKIELSTNSGTTWSIIDSSLANTGEYFWTINAPLGSEESLIRVCDAIDSNATDISDGVFTILPVNIFISSPNGGEVWISGSTHEITWSTQNLTASVVRILLSTNAGINWNIIAPLVVNNGLYNWLIDPGLSSGQCLIKIETINHLVFDISDSLFTIEVMSGAAEDINASTINEFKLNQNFPNPFNPTTTIKFTIPSVLTNVDKQTQLVILKVYNILGIEIETLVDEEKPAGTYEVEFTAETFPSGIYFYRLEAGDFIDTKKMILLK